MTLLLKLLRLPLLKPSNFSKKKNFKGPALNEGGSFLSLPLSRTGELKGENALDVVGAASLRKHELEEDGGLLRGEAAGADAAGRK